LHHEPALARGAKHFGLVHEYIIFLKRRRLGHELDLYGVPCWGATVSFFGTSKAKKEKGKSTSTGTHLDGEVFGCGGAADKKCVLGVSNGEEGCKHL
jgi:hypothetical protein